MEKILAGRYEIVRELGSGSTGKVYLCKDLSENRNVAVKQISGALVETVRREFQILRSIEHPQIARALDYIEDPSSETGYLVQEFIEGADLFTATRDADFTSIAQMGVEIALALDFLHSKGIIHGDLKPQNIVAPSGEKMKPALLDFGLAVQSGTDNSVRGSPAYMAPELVGGGFPSALSDVYSLGAVLYHCVSGSPPYSGADVSDTLRSIIYDRYTPLWEKVPTVPRPLADAIDKALERDPIARYQSAGAVARDLAKFVGVQIPQEQPRSGRRRILGRDDELAELKGFVEKAGSAGSPSAVLIHGEKGMGTSRLLEAVSDHARIRGCRVYFLSAFSSKDAARTLLSQLPENGGAGRSGRESNKIADEEKTLLAARRAVAEKLRFQAPQARVVVAFDDLEESADSAVELFRFLSIEFADGAENRSPILIIAAFAGALSQKIADDVKAGWIRDVELKPLSRDAIAAAIEETWGIAPSERAIGKLAEISGGNPLWLREILKTVTDEEKVAEARAPESASELIRKSLSGLPVERIRLLEAVSVFGEPVAADEIAGLIESSASLVAPPLIELTDRGFLKNEDGYFSVASPLLSEQVVGDAALSVKIRLHKKSADLLGSRKNPAPEIIARHLIAANDAVQAASYIFSAGERLRKRGAHHEAASMFDSFLKKFQGDVVLKKKALEALARFAAPAGMWKEALAALRERLEIAQDDLPNARAAFHNEMASCQQRIGEYDRAERAARRALDELKNDETAPEYFKAKERLILLDIAQGRYKDAIAACDDIIGKTGYDKNITAPFQTARGVASVYTGRIKEALDSFDVAIKAYRAEEDFNGLTLAQSGLGMAYQSLQKNEDALKAYNDALESSRKAGDLRAESAVAMNVATIFQSMQKWGDAKLHYRRALALARQVGAAADEVRVSSNLGNLLFYLGDYDGASPIVERALAGAKNLGLKSFEAYTSLLRGDLQKHVGEMIAAGEDYKSAARLFDQLGVAGEAVQTKLRLGRLYLEMGERKKASEIIAEVKRDSEKIGVEVLEGEAAMLDARWKLLYGRPDEALKSAQTAADKLKNAGESYAWEADATLGAALLAAGRKAEAKSELQKAYETAIRLRDSLPIEYRDSFLSGAVWNELNKNVVAAKSGDAAEPDERWKKLLEISRRLTVERNLSRLLELIMDSVLELVKAERGFLILIEDGKMTIPTARNIDKESVRGAKMKISRSIAEEVSKTGAPLMTVDAQRDSRLDQFASVRDLKLRSVLCVPLKIRDRSVGALYVDNRFQEGAFHEEDSAIMEAFASHAAISIDNARASAEIEQSNIKIRELADELEKRVDKQSEQIERMRIELDRRGSAENVSQYPEIIGKSSAMRRVFEVMDRVAAADAPVLIEGESGSGKELVARAIHFHGPRKNTRFLSENCSAIPETLLESELFGYEKGAFTGASDRKTGLFEMADGGTLFLDEIGDMSPGMQAKLLRVLQDGEVRRVGGEKSFFVNVRVISATHQRLEELVQKGKFREDLYWRLNVIKITVPPLRDRLEDVPLLADHFRAKASGELGKEITIDEDAMKTLISYDWRGNVRELENEIRKAAVLGDGMISAGNLSPRILASLLPRKYAVPTLKQIDSLKSAVEEFEKNFLLKVLEECGGNRAEAARRLRIGRRTLYDKLGRYGVEEE